MVVKEEDIREHNQHAQIQLKIIVLSTVDALTMYQDQLLEQQIALHIMSLVAILYWMIIRVLQV
jgi:hypothetical protein